MAKPSAQLTEDGIACRDVRLMAIVVRNKQRALPRPSVLREKDTSRVYGARHDTLAGAANESEDVMAAARIGRSHIHSIACAAGGSDRTAERVGHHIGLLNAHHLDGFIVGPA